ncbi:MAG TPA: TonB-dependent receptor [Gemmatimonadaceae bacterium]|nr:TonB-dependent receptor [Gemmatimonadaceae bacterium]
MLKTPILPSLFQLTDSMLISPFGRAPISALLLLLPALAFAQQALPTAPADSAARAKRLRALTITATRQKTDVHDVAAPVSVLDSADVRERAPNNPADLLRELPGVDVIGVGPNQTRPSIRGQRGQRILLLEDGIRLNNSRRQQDFGELPALIDVSAVERVEVVRGPASVLYGTDAIGGVINLITRAPAYGHGPPATTGRLGYRYGSAGDLGKADGSLAGRAGLFAWQLGGSWRRAANYDSPAGTFGNVRLANDATVIGTGVKDHSENAYLGWRAKSGLGAFLRAEQYVANDAGFAYVPNRLLGGDSTKIDIRYPYQDFKKLTFGATSGTLGLPVADRAELTAYTQRNQRDLAQDIYVPFGPGTPPGAGVGVKSANHTDLATIGFRAEAAKVLPKMVLTYGVDAFEDRSFNTDTSTTTVWGFGPPTPRGTNTSSVPNALLSSIGGFAQSSFTLFDRATLTVGARGQRVQSEPRLTPGVATSSRTHANGTGVYAANGLVRVTNALNVVASVGRGFRAPNLVERYFDGPTPEGGAYQAASPDLRPETSLNYDLGFKYRRMGLDAEASVFESDIRDGITTAPTGSKRNRLPVYQNVNVGKLRTRGAELAASLMLDRGFSLSGNWSTIKTDNLLDPKSPIGDTFANKLNLALGWFDPSGRFWAQYAARRNGEQRDIALGSSPVGDVLPAFTVHAIRGGVRGWRVGGLRQDVTIVVNNLTNALYAEAANASFFRPEPKRNVVISISTAF